MMHIFLGVTVSSHHRFLTTDFTLQEEEYRVVNIYMPTSDKEKRQIETLEELNESLDPNDTPHLFVGGDFNIARDSSLDREGYVHPNIPNTLFRSQLNLFLERADIGDTWRIQNSTTKEFTWSRSGKFARLDYLFAPLTFPGQIKAFHPRTCAFSDHRMIILEIRPCRTPKGMGFWKFPTSLLQREDFCTEATGIIEQADIESEGLQADLKWDFIKLKIREFAIRFAKKLKQEYSRLESEMETRLFLLEKDIMVSKESQEEYHGIKRELYQIQLLKARESMVRSKVRWVGEGERPTKYFLNLEKKQFDSKTISSIFNEEGILLKEAEEILQYEHKHFTQQYSINHDNREALDQGEGAPFLPQIESLISDLDKQLLNRELSLEELENALKDMKNGKSPGCDGLPPDLYKQFWPILGKYLLASFLYSGQQGILTPDQRRGIITLIPKKGKDKRLIRNWRPISMLNTDYKILAKVLAKRLSSVLPSLVHPNQTGFIPTRFIGDNIRNTQAIIDFTTQTGRSGLVVSLDFRAAFDSLDHQFLMQALNTYRLGDFFSSWIATLYASAESCVLNGGQSSGWFPFQRGIRQGCPISPFLFALAVEKMADEIRRKENIVGLDLLNTHTKILQFADDSTLFLKTESSLVQALQTVTEFKRVSGLDLNLQKTHGLVLGDLRLETDVSKQITWSEQVKILGINFDINEYEGKDQTINFDPALAKMRRVCTSWDLRNLSLKGKVVILNTLVLPIIYFQCTMLPVPATTLEQTEKIISAFIWKNKKPKISRLCLEKSTGKGGLGLHNIRNRVKAAKISWLKRLAKPPSEPWHFYLEFKTDMTGVEVAQRRVRQKRKMKRVALFFSEVYEYWFQLFDKEPAVEIAIRNELLWGNKFLRGRVKKKHETFCQAKGIHKINDLLTYGKIMTDEEFLERYGSSPPTRMLTDLAQVIPHHWLQTLSHAEQHLSASSLYIMNEKREWVDIQLLSAKQIYAIFEDRKPEGYTCRERWLKAYDGDETFDSLEKWREWSLLPYRISHEVQLQSFALKIRYRIIPCRVYLHRLKVVDSECCAICAGRDDIFHFFFECPTVHSFWNNLATWMGGREGISEFPHDLTEEEFLLGIISKPGDQTLMNYIILFAKFYVYKTRIFGSGEPDLMHFLLEMKNRLSIERACCFAEASYSKRFKKWELFYNNL